MSSFDVGLEGLEQPALSSLAVGRGLEGLELWLGRLFTAAELAAADLLLRLSGDDASGASTSTTPSSSPGWVSPCRDDLTVDEEVEKRVVEEPAVSTELDRRARKRYRLLSELYAPTVPVTSASNTAKKKRKRHHDHDGSSSAEEATRYGGWDTTPY